MSGSVSVSNTTFGLSQIASDSSSTSPILAHRKSGLDWLCSDPMYSVPYTMMVKSVCSGQM